MQVDFGQGRPWIDATGKKRRSHVFRAVLSYSRKGYTEVVPRQTTEHLIRVLENAFWKLGGVPKVVVFDNAKCAVTKADWYDPEIQPSYWSSANTTAVYSCLPSHVRLVTKAR